jgi:glycosyltransferase involved in cell wall biosynthesis
VSITVLYVSHTAHVSGGERSLLDLLRALPADVTPIVAAPAGDLARRLTDAGVEVHTIAGTDASLRLGLRSTPLALSRLTAMALSIRRIARSTGADLVHANSIRAGLVASLASVLGAPPTVAHIRDRLPDGRVPSLLLGALARRSAALIANSEYTMRRTPPGGRAPRCAIHSPVDLARFSPDRYDRARARERLGVSGTDPVLGVIGQLSPWKAQDDAIRILAEVRRRHPGARLLIVGSAKFTSAETRYDNRAHVATLERLVSELDIEGDVLFLGEREDVPEILSALDLLLLPSWEEPFGRAVAEAMAMGVPVIATSVGGPSEIIVHGRDGLLLPPREPRRWAREIADLLDRPTRLSAMADAGRKRAVAELGVRSHAERVVSLYREVVVPGQQ